MRTEFVCVSVLRVASGPKVKFGSCKSALNPPVVYSTDRSIVVVPVLVLLFVSLWFILRGDLLYVFPCVILFLCFLVLLVLRLPRLGKRELILVLFVRLFDLCLFGFVGFLFLLGSGKGCGLWLWHSLGFSLPFLCTVCHGLFVLPLGVLCWRFVYCLSWFVCSTSWCNIWSVYVLSFRDCLLFLLVLLVGGLYTVYHGLFALPLGVIGLLYLLVSLVV